MVSIKRESVVKIKVEDSPAQIEYVVTSEASSENSDGKYHAESVSLVDLPSKREDVEMDLASNSESQNLNYESVHIEIVQED
jgi:hypothetical protein